MISEDTKLLNDQSWFSRIELSASVSLDRKIGVFEMWVCRRETHRRSERRRCI